MNKHKKIPVLFFVFFLFAGLVSTCVFGFREIGSDLYHYYMDEKNSFSAGTVDGFFARTDKTLSDNFFLHGLCIDIYGLIQRLEGKTVIRDADDSKTVVKGSDGKLYFASNVLSEKSAGERTEYLSANADSLIALNDFCLGSDACFLYVTAPAKYDASSVTLPIRVSEDTFGNAGAMENILTENKVPNLNLQRMLKEEDGDYSDNFFITDHHWTIASAFSGYNKMMTALNSLPGFDRVDEKYFSPDSFSAVTLKKAYLGSMGVRTGRFFAGKDDIDIISPGFETDFRVSYYTKTLNKQVTSRGDFSAVIHGDTPDYYYITSDNSLVCVDNLLNNSGHRILFVKDSFGVPVSGWLACAADRLYIVDLRYAQEKSVYDYVGEYDIDTVIVMYNAEMLLNSSLFDFSEISKGY